MEAEVDLTLASANPVRNNMRQMGVILQEEMRHMRVTLQEEMRQMGAPIQEESVASGTA